MKGGAVPSLSSRDRLPGLAVATPGLYYVVHKSSSCFTNALPHLSAGLICQAKLPGKFFCKRNRHSYKLHFSCPLFLFYTPSLPPTHAHPIFAVGSPRCSLMLLTVVDADTMANLYCATASVIVSTEVLTSTHPHRIVASVLQLQAKQIPPQFSCSQRVFHHGNLFPFFDSWSKTLTGSWKPQGN